MAEQESAAVRNANKHFRKEEQAGKRARLPGKNTLSKRTRPA